MAITPWFTEFMQTINLLSCNFLSNTDIMQVLLWEYFYIKNFVVSRMFYYLLLDLTSLDLDVTLNLQWLDTNSRPTLSYRTSFVVTELLWLLLTRSPYHTATYYFITHHFNFSIINSLSLIGECRHIPPHDKTLADKSGVKNILLFLPSHHNFVVYVK